MDKTEGGSSKRPKGACKGTCDAELLKIGRVKEEVKTLGFQGIKCGLYSSGCQNYCKCQYKEYGLRSDKSELAELDAQSQNDITVGNDESKVNRGSRWLR